MRQKGFATILGLCLILVFALIVKGIQESETNHARAVLNFELELALQNAAESVVVEAAEYVRNNPDYLPYSTARESDKKKISVASKSFKHGDKTLSIKLDVRGERGKIYVSGNPHDGVYFMSRAMIDGGLFGEKIYRRAYAYVLDDDATIYFMELP